MTPTQSLEDVLAAHRPHVTTCTCGAEIDPDQPTHQAAYVRGWLVGQTDLIARTLAQIEPGEGWPTNEALGGHALLGTRDDEFKAAMDEQAAEVVAALTNVGQS